MLRDKRFAAILAMLFGVLGLQKLYLGRGFEFILCIVGLILTAGIFPFLFGIYDGLKLWNMDWYTFNDKYNRVYRNTYKG